jgi:hypothetical protein
MDDAKFLLFTLILSSCLCGRTVASAAELEYITPERQHVLEQQFDHAAFQGTHEEQKRLAEGQWSCKMYGVRSHLQVQSNLKLYKWSAPDGQAWHNGGAQLVSEYKPAAGALIGTHERFEDQVKLTKDGQLISRLSVNSPDAKVVVAFSICDAE